MTRSRLLCNVLAVCWRRQPPEVDFPQSSLDEIWPLLHGSGAAALAWWKIQGTPLEVSSVAQQLQQVRRLQTLQCAIREYEIEQVFALFRSSRVEPILVKGWAAARHYAEPALRPYGDIDLIVRPEQRGTAEALLKTPEAQRWNVDLTHADFAQLGCGELDTVYTRCEIVDLSQSRIRVLGAEDHLRVLCAHLFRHGAWRPLWLCDIAAALESRAAGLDWDRCLRGNRREAEWVAAATGLANQLLGARVEDTPVSQQARRLPKWLIPAVLKQWEHAVYADHPLLHPIWSSLRHLSSLPEALRRRWPDPIEATALTGAPFNETPRLIFQLSLCLSRSTEFLIRPLRPHQHGHQF